MNSTEEPASDGGSTASNAVQLATFIFIPILIVSTVGNVLVLYSICVKPRFFRPANFMLANLSLNSILQISSMLSVLLQKKYPLLSYGPLTCHLFPIVHTCSVPVDGFTVMCISVERSNVVTRPHERESGKSVRRKIAAIWIASLLIELPHGFFWDFAQDTPSYLKCVNTKQLFGSKVPYVMYACAYFLVVVILPVSVMLRESLLLAGRLKFLISVKAEWSQYQLCTYKLIRNALLFIIIFICLKLPSSVVYLATRMPPGVFPQSVCNWASDWKSIVFTVGALNGSVYAVVIFSLSNKMRELFACFTETQSPPPARSLYRMSARPVHLPLQPF